MVIPICSQMSPWFALAAQEVADVIMQQIIEASPPPVRVQTNPTIQAVFEKQLGQNVSGGAALEMATSRFLADV